MKVINTYIVKHPYNQGFVITELFEIDADTWHVIISY